LQITDLKELIQSISYKVYYVNFRFSTTIWYLKI